MPRGGSPALLSLHFSMISFIHSSFLSSPTFCHFLQCLWRIPFVFADYLCALLHFPDCLQNWGFTAWLPTESACVTSRARHLKATVPSPSLAQHPWEPGAERTGSWGGKNLDSWVWQEVSSCQLALDLVWERNKLALCWAPEICGFICYHSIVEPNPSNYLN